ncbi:CDP-alcohol phosphatidyltransferase family protein [Halolamina rubra]|uniref:CDP-alcohol phosphatidyltransferase family protein n=1 Tax=Halolamina rubra TaxID=1380430 RepID=UPI00067887FF|nr:CDP-alcohol phosphatidyltransferase family protein [Halolamina rubra]
MTLDQYRELADRLLVPFVDAAEALGLTPDGVSVIAFGFAGAAGAAFALAGGQGPLWLYLAASLFVFANGWLDLVDGALARELGTDSKGGDLLDHVLDRYADVLIIAGLAAGADAWALGLLAVTGVLLTSYLGTQIQAVGLGREYGGLLGRADRLALVGVVGVVAFVLPGELVAGVGAVELLLALFAVVGHLTALQRFWGAWSDLS